MMGQMVKRKKRGRPPKSDRHSRGAPDEEDRDIRRSLRRRNVKYVFDLDDYFDDDELFDDGEEQRRREKKLKHLLVAETQPSKKRRVNHAPGSSASSSDSERYKSSKKRIIDEEVDYENDEVNEEEEDEVRERKPEYNAYEDSPPGTPSEGPAGVQLPDKKALELILDKLQKKDIYGVYAEPVDPEELPDYHDVIKHPMDFGTVRKKLANGSYVTFPQFESDVFLICSNAMQYNPSDTIYHKQARSIQELAKRKFDKIRLKVEFWEKDIKSDRKIISSSVLKKQIRSVSRMVQEPVCSDFSSGTTLATPADVQNVSNAVLAVGHERPGNIEGLVERNSVFKDNNADRGEELLPGKSPLSKFGRKSFVHDENRRSTYSISIALPVVSSESMLSTFDEESKHLVPVGLYSDHSYARSLTHFAASLGSVAWRVASKRIEQAVPEGFKFGPGWVGEYEPLPTPVLILENCVVKEPVFSTKPQPALDPGKFEKLPIVSDSSKHQRALDPGKFEKMPMVSDSSKSQPTLDPGSSEKIPMVSDYSKESPSSEPFLQNNLPFLTHAGNRQLSAPIYTTSHPVKVHPIRGNVSEVKPTLFSSPGIKPRASADLINQHQNSYSGISVESDKRVLKQVELNGPPSFSRTAADTVIDSRISKSSEIEASRSNSRNFRFSPSGSFKQPDSNGSVEGGLPNVKATGNRLDNKTAPASSSHLANAVSYNPPREEGMGLSDPVQLMRMFTEKAQNQQKLSNKLMPDMPQVFSSGTSDSNNAALAAARAWMSVGAGGFRPAGENMNMHRNQIFADSLYNSTGDCQLQVSRFRGDFPATGMQVQTDRNSMPFHAFVTQGPRPTRVCNEIQYQNQQKVFPQMVTADLSRFQMPTNWRNLSLQMHSRQNPESLPPDLNIGFQSSGSPGKPPSGVLVDSQQPDLVLQL